MSITTMTRPIADVGIGELLNVCDSVDQSAVDELGADGGAATTSQEAIVELAKQVKYYDNVI